MGNVSFAEGDTVCSGKISGVSPLDNVNAGQISFDAHPDENKAISLAVAGLADGLAPASGEYAACINKESGTYNGAGYDYAVKGWSWNTNGGFISFNCKDGKNTSGDTGGGIACGAIDYGVYINSVTGEVFGHAWSPTYGWIQFKGAGAGFNYGVKLDAQKVTSGHAWTQAGIYIDFSGLKFNLPDDVIVDPVEGKWCEGKPWLCVEVDPDPSELDVFDPNDPDSPDYYDPKNPTGGGSSVVVGVEADQKVKLADGQDGYFLHVYLREADGKTALDKGKYNVDEFLGGIKFNWNDTVKIDQTFKKPKNEVKKTLDSEPTPWVKGLGAITFKPLVYTGNFEQFKKADGTLEPGHYVTTKKISSFAPTTESKKSFTTSTKPNFGVKNDEFVHDIGKGALEPNQLILKSITFNKDLKSTADGKVLLKQGAIYPNGEVNLAFKFKPAIIVNKLYSNDFEDVILAYRSIPINFKVSLIVLSEIFKGDKEIMGSAKATFTLDYDESATGSQAECQSPNVYKDFKFNFTDSSGKDLGQSLSKVVKDIFGQEWNAQAVAKIEQCAELDAQGKCKNDPKKLPCGIAKGANLYTQVEYKKDGKIVKYYDNRLPRITGDATLNPVIVVHGNIFAQAAANLSSDSRIQTSGNVNINIIRDTINENLKKYAKNLDNLKGGSCKITAFGSAPVCKTATYSSFLVRNGTGTADDENVLYFRNTDVTVELKDGSWTKNWVVISDGGNIFVDSDIYNENGANYLSLVAFRAAGDNYFKTGNIYIAPCSKNVNNIQANIIADGSVFSYSDDKSKLDKTTGEPIWDSYVHMIGSLNCQLKIEGALHSDNTIGGADLDQGEKPRDYLLGGGGKIIKLPVGIEERMKAQYFDLNYLRLFRLTLQTSDEGLPIDQKCGKAWTIEDQQKWLEILAKYDETGEDKTAICGEKPGCNPNKTMFQKSACNGVNPLAKYDPDDEDSGDLITPKTADALAKGLDNEKDFEPVYIYYKAPMKGSFVFSKKGAIDIGGN